MPDQQQAVTGALNVTGALVGVIMTCLLGFALWALIFVQVPDANQNVLLVLIGALTTNVTAIVAYFYGASLGSRQKDATIATQTDTAAKAQAALAPIVSALVPDNGKVVLSPGDHVEVAATPVKPADMKQEEWDSLSADEKKVRAKEV